MRASTWQPLTVLVAVFLVGVIGWHLVGVWVPLLACVVVPVAGAVLARRRSAALRGR